ncbi:hypothetical protein HK103_003752 [Boothiomyces macroporosus]|uniref:Uncharacterized protein n=1 Tax=Boothiomyces macroporosus TaxID=261099 RepID=A0AAD5UJX2_9FUNG|nr:hypothetical protein HK103_003752 [Boothiomyces macroporosus]
MDRITTLDTLLLTSDSDATDSSKEEVKEEKKKRKKREPKAKKTLDVPTIDGAPQLPLQLGVITLVNLGTITTKPGFHTDRYIYPVGFQTVRQYLSMIDPNNVTEYTSTVLDGGDGPKFQIVAKDDAANKIRNKDHSNSASGPDYFGFSQPTIMKLIQAMPNADQCTLFKFQKVDIALIKFDQPKEKRPRKKRQLSSEELVVDSPKELEVSDSQDRAELIATQEKLIQKAEKAQRLERQRQERNAKKLEKEMAKKANLVPNSPFGNPEIQYQGQFMQDERIPIQPNFQKAVQERINEQQFIQSQTDPQGQRNDQKMYKFINQQEWQPPVQPNFTTKPPMLERIPSKPDMYNQRSRNDQQYGYDPRKMDERMSIDTRNLNNSPYKSHMNKESPMSGSPFQNEGMIPGKQDAPASFNSESSMNSLPDTMMGKGNYNREHHLPNINSQQFNRGSPVNRQFMQNSQSPTEYQLHMQMKQDPNMRFVDTSRSMSMNELARSNSNSSRTLSINERMASQDGRILDPNRFSPHGMEMRIDPNRNQQMMMDPNRNSPMSDRFSPMSMENRNIDPRLLNNQMQMGNRGQMMDMSRVQMVDNMNRNPMMDPNRRNQVDANAMNRNQMMETPSFGSDLRISAIESELDNAMQLNSFPSNGNYNQIHQYQNK